MKKVQARLEAKAREREELLEQAGAVGHLEDMNLIDLLQALGPSQKTAKVTVNSGRDSLVIFLKQGAIMNAETANCSGPEAVYEGIAWKKGSWTIQPVDPETLPPQNTYYSNESLLMEGCRLLDEKLNNSARIRTK